MATRIVVAPPSITEVLLENLCALAGTRFQGCFKSFRDKDGNLTEAVALFEAPKTKTTLGLPISKMNVRNIRARIAESDALYEQFSERASHNVLSQFSQSQNTHE